MRVQRLDLGGAPHVIELQILCAPCNATRATGGPKAHCFSDVCYAATPTPASQEDDDATCPAQPASEPKELNEAGAPAAATPVRSTAAKTGKAAAAAAVQAAQAAATSSMRKIQLEVLQQEEQLEKHGAEVQLAVETAVARERDLAKAAVEKAIVVTTKEMTRRQHEAIANEQKHHQRLGEALGSVVREKDALARQVEELRCGLEAPLGVGARLRACVHALYTDLLPFTE